MIECCKKIQTIRCVESLIKRLVIVMHVFVERILIRIEDVEQLVIFVRLGILMSDSVLVVIEGTN